jgi:hypothetical protein
MPVEIYDRKQEMHVSTHAGMIDGSIKVVLRFRPLGNPEEVTDSWMCGVGRDPIRAWRAAVILSQIDEISTRDMAVAVELTNRTKTLSRTDNMIDELLAKLPPGSYLRIMREPVPAYIIDEAISRNTDRFLLGGFADGIYGELASVAEEMRHATLTWRPEFKPFGILHPTSAVSAINDGIALANRFPSVRRALETDWGLTDPSSPYLQAFYTFLNLAYSASIAFDHGDDVAIALALYLALGGTQRAHEGVSHWAAAALREISSFRADRIYVYRFKLETLKHEWHGRQEFASP